MRRLAARLVALALALALAVSGDARAEEGALAPPDSLPPGALVLARRAPGFGGAQRLTDDDYARKNEGGYFTGLPLLAYDPNYGVGAGARVYYYYDGYRQDPLFAYTPYLHRLFAQTFFSSGGAQDHVIDYDAPTFLGSLYRVRVTLEFEAATDWPYFGVGSRSMAPLSFPGAPGRTFAKMSDYQTATSAMQPDGTTYARYNTFEFRRPVLQLALERLLAGGVLRSMVGANFAYMDLHDYSGSSVPTSATDPGGNTVRAPEATTLLGADCATGRIIGCSGGWDNTLRLGLSVDTRDFEPDPNSGVYAELSGEYGTRALGSQYEYMRLMLSVRGFYSPVPRAADLVLALRGLYEVQSKRTPFFSQAELPFIDDNHTGLGGFRTMRGFAQNRFVGPIIALTNYEVRWTFAKFRALGQGFGLIAVPFLDVGRVFDDVDQTTLAGWQRSQGAGLRVAWNEATIIMADYGFSDEDSGLYLNFNHIF